MQRLEIHPQTPQARHLKTIADSLSKGGLVLYPTDSGYAIGCNAENTKAIHRLYALKKPMKKFFMALLFADLSQATQYAIISNFAFSVMKNRVPGPYTFILPADPGIARRLDVKRAEIGIRMPTHPFLRELFQHLDFPLLSTAAKLEEDYAPSNADELATLFQHSVDYMADLGDIAISPTNIVSLVHDEIDVLRGEL